MMRFATLLLCVSACSSDPAEQAVLLVSERTAPELPVAFETMDRLLGARVPTVAHPGDTVEVLVDLQWSSTPPDEVELTLWKAGGSEPVLAEVLGIENAQSGQAQGIVWSPTLSSGFEEGAYWVMLRLRTSQGVVEADEFSNGWVMLGMTWVIPSGHLLPPTPLPAPELPADEARGLLAVGGDLNAGRRQNGISGARGLDEAFSRLALFRDADLGYANLESVISDIGEQGVEKGEDAPFYYRGRPEQTGLLVHAGIDVVGTANNHSGDYGPEALLRQAELLDLAGVVGVGSGRTRTEACEARYAWAGPIRVGFVAIDTTQKRFAADAENPGACFVDLENLTGGHGEWAQAIAAAKNQADVVVAGVHWGKNNRSRPVRETREFAHTLIAAGADAVLGSSAHRLQGVEVFRGKPILYDAGNLLFDSHLSGEAARSAVFNLTLTTRGVHRIEVVPISVGYGRVSEASDNLAARVLRRFRLLSAELGTPTRVVGERVWIDLLFNEESQILNETIGPMSPRVSRFFDRRVSLQRTAWWSRCPSKQGWRIR